MAKKFQIKVDAPLIRSCVPGHVLRSGAFYFSPNDFGVGNEYLNAKIISSEVQTRSLQGFLEDPGYPCVYGVGSAPDDARAKYFAAFLVQRYMQAKPNHRVLWHHLYGSFSNPLIENDEPASMLVLTGLAPNSTAAKLEKCRDLLEHYSNIPRVVVVSGVDPVTFFRSVLYQRMTNMFYYASSAVKQKIEVV